MPRLARTRKRTPPAEKTMQPTTCGSVCAPAGPPAAFNRNAGRQLCLLLRPDEGGPGAVDKGFEGTPLHINVPQALNTGGKRVLGALNGKAVRHDPPPPNAPHSPGSKGDEARNGGHASRGACFGPICGGSTAPEPPQKAASRHCSACAWSALCLAAHRPSAGSAPNMCPQRNALAFCPPPGHSCAVGDRPPAARGLPNGMGPLPPPFPTRPFPIFPGTPSPPLPNAFGLVEVQRAFGLRTGLCTCAARAPGAGQRALAGDARTPSPHGHFGRPTGHRRAEFSSRKRPKMAINRDFPGLRAFLAKFVRGLNRRA